MEGTTDLSELPHESLVELARSSPPVRQIAPDHTIDELSREFAETPELLGVVVTLPGDAPIVVSRHAFTQRLNQVFLREIYHRRTIGELVRTWPSVSLVMHERTPVADAIELALARPGDAAYEPILVVGGPDGMRLVDMRELLARQCAQLSAARDELAWQRDAAQQAARSKSEFLANMSHEIRTPMTAILGYAELLRDPSLTADQRADYLTTIERSGNHLLGILEDILDLSKLEAGRLPSVTGPTDVIELVEDVYELMRERAAARGLEFVRTFDWPLPEMIESDAQRLRQILINLVSNAIKFTDQGSVTIQLGVTERDESHAVLELAVVDTGPGLRPEEIDRLFRPFTQGDTSHRRRHGGAGLGLAISRRLADMLGARIDVRSEVGRGSRFALRLELRAPQALTWRHEPRARNRGAATPQLASLGGRRILVVEDSRDNQRLLQAILTKAGAAVEIVENGRAALQLLRSEGGRPAPFDLVLMDMQMPELDGYAATETLRRNGLEVPVIALTANALRGDRDRCLAAGCDDYLTKPIDRARLLACCGEWIDRRHPLRSA